MRNDEGKENNDEADELGDCVASTRYVSEDKEAAGSRLGRS